MALGVDYVRQDCSLARALEVVGERWTLLILRDCFLGVRRFSDFEAHLDISKAVLTARLSALVDAGLLDAGRRRARGVRRHRPRPRAVAGDVRADPVGRGALRARTAADLRARGLRRPGRPDRPVRRVRRRTRRPRTWQTRPGPGADPTVRDDAVSKALRVPHRLLEPLATRG